MKNVISGGALVEHRLLDVINGHAVVVRDLARLLAGIDASGDRRRRDAVAGDDRAPEWTAGAITTGIAESGISREERVQSDRELVGGPLDPDEMRLEHVTHRDLPGPREIDQFTVPLEKQFARPRSQFRAEEQPVDLQLLLGVSDGLSDLAKSDALVGSERPKHVRLDEVPEGKDRRPRRRGPDERLKPDLACGDRVGAAQRPGWHLHEPRAFGDGICRLICEDRCSLSPPTRF